MFLFKTRKADCCEPKTRAEYNGSMCYHYHSTVTHLQDTMRLFFTTWLVGGVPLCIFDRPVFDFSSFAKAGTVHLCCGDWARKAAHLFSALVLYNLKSHIKSQFPTGYCVFFSC